MNQNYKTMSNSINVSAVDNEIYIIACNSTISYQLCHVLSGYNFSVDVTADILAGPYTEPETLNGLGGPLSTSYNVTIPSGTYSIMAVGIDWGGGQQAQLSVNGQSFGSGNYNPGPTVVPTVFWTNNGSVLTTITV